MLFAVHPKMKVLGIGVDVVETARIEASLAKFGDRFLHRVFVEGEIAYCSAMARPALHYAARFAAKEAVSKALGTGLHGISWRDVEVLPDRRGKPLVFLRRSDVNFVKVARSS